MPRNTPVIPVLIYIDGHVNVRIDFQGEHGKLDFSYLQFNHEQIHNCVVFDHALRSHQEGMAPARYLESARA